MKRILIILFLLYIKANINALDSSFEMFRQFGNMSATSLIKTLEHDFDKKYINFFKDDKYKFTNNVNNIIKINKI